MAKRKPHAYTVDGWNNTTESPAALDGSIGSCVYALRTEDDLVKIGFTTNLADRRRKHRADWSRLLAITPGTLADEQAIHRRLKPHRARGHEIYRPTADVFAVVNEVRERYGLEPITDRWPAPLAL